MNTEKVQLIKEYFLETKYRRYNALQEIYSSEELLNKPILILYKEVLETFEITENELVFLNFKQGLKMLRRKLKNNPVTKKVEQPFSSNPAKENESVNKFSKEYLDKWLEENPLPLPTVQSTNPKDLLKPAYPKK